MCYCKQDVVLLGVCVYLPACVNMRVQPGLQARVVLCAVVIRHPVKTHIVGESIIVRLRRKELPMCTCLATSWIPCLLVTSISISRCRPSLRDSTHLHDNWRVGASVCHNKGVNHKWIVDLLKWEEFHPIPGIDFGQKSSLENQLLAHFRNTWN